MSWRLRLSVETILRLTPAVLGLTVFSIAGAVHQGWREDERFLGELEWPLR